MSSDVERWRGPAGDLIEWADAARAAHDLAKGLTATEFVPEQFRGKPVEAMAAIIAGAEVGLSPMQALNSTYVIGGRPAYYARTMVALVQRQGHEVWTEKSTPASVTVCGSRAGSDKVERVTVTADAARRAGWTRNRQYESNPEAMLWARAASTVCRRIAADALLGIPYSAEELQDEAAAGESAVTRTVKRRGKHPAGSALPELPAPVSVNVNPDQVGTVVQLPAREDADAGVVDEPVGGTPDRVDERGEGVDGDDDE